MVPVVPEIVHRILVCDSKNMLTSKRESGPTKDNCTAFPLFASYPESDALASALALNNVLGERNVDMEQELEAARKEVGQQLNDVVIFFVFENFIS